VAVQAGNDIPDCVANKSAEPVSLVYVAGEPFIVLRHAAQLVQNHLDDGTALYIYFFLFINNIKLIIIKVNYYLEPVPVIFLNKNKLNTCILFGMVLY
jgi:hypothetical protein